MRSQKRGPMRSWTPSRPLMKIRGWRLRAYCALPDLKLSRLNQPGRPGNTRPLHYAGSNQRSALGSGVALPAYSTASRPNWALLLDNLKPEIAPAAAAQIIAPTDSPKFSRLRRVQINHLASAGCIYAGVIKSPYYRLRLTR